MGPNPAHASIPALTIRCPLRSVKFVAQAGADNLIGDAGVELGGQRHVLLIVDVRRRRAERHIEVFDLAGPISPKVSLDAAGRLGSRWSRSRW